MAALLYNFRLKASELEREKRVGGSEKYPKTITDHPVFVINQKSNQLLLSKRGKLKTVREKNAEELIKQGKRWERERLLLEEQERLKEISTKREREKMLEEQTLYIFDAEKVDLSGMDLLKLKSRKFTECEIDVKDFLLSEKNKKRTMAKAQSSEDRFEEFRSFRMIINSVTRCFKYTKVHWKLFEFQVLFEKFWVLRQAQLFVEVQSFDLWNFDLKILRRKNELKKLLFQKTLRKLMVEWKKNFAELSFSLRHA